MRIIYIYCEGPTEESFINKIIYPYMFKCGVIVKPIICTTKRTPNKKYRGGVSKYSIIKKELSRLCKQHHNEIVTTMFDYYGMPDDTPEIENKDTDLYNRIAKIEEAINKDIGQTNCYFHFMLHEFEAILFSNPDSFKIIADENAVSKIQRIRDNYDSPEHINKSPMTAPSKRLEELIPNYPKIINGTRLSNDMGIDVILENCRHFREWVDWMKTL